MEAQRKAVDDFLNGGEWEVVEEFTEVESGKRKDRPELLKAVDLSRKKRARLVIAKLDRLARNAAFLLTLRDSGVDFVAADMPQADKLTVGIMAVFAEHERDMISKRTKEALAAAKRRGVRLGCPDPQKGSALGIQRHREFADQFARNVKPVIEEIKGDGITTLRGIAGVLNRRGFKTPGGRQFAAQSVANAVARVC